jgi:hypothetical protein
MERICSRRDGVPFLDLLCAADRVANAAMCLVVHQTNAENVYIDGRSLAQEYFKELLKSIPAVLSAWFPHMSATWH